MPRIAAKSVSAANNDPLPDFWEFFYISTTGEIDGIGAALSTILPQHEFYLIGTYAVEHSKLCSSAIHRRRTPFPTPDESGNYSKKVLGL